MVEEPLRPDDPRAPRRVGVDDLVPVPRVGAEEERLPEREPERFGVRGVLFGGVIPVRVPVDRDQEIPAEGGHHAGVIQSPDFLLLHREVQAPHEGLEVLPHFGELFPVFAIEPFLRPVIFPHRKGGFQPEAVEFQAVEEPFVVAEEGRGVPGALCGEGDPLDVDDPAAGATRKGEEAEHRLVLPVEGEGEVPHRLVPADDLAVVEDPVLPEQEEAVAVGKAEDLRGKRVQEPRRRDAVREEVAPEREHAVVRRVPADEERRPFSALLDDRGVEFGAEEPVRRDQQVEPLEDVALRQGIAEPPRRQHAVFRHRAFII